MSKLTDAVTNLTATVEAQNTVVESAIAYIEGVPTMIEQARQDAIDAGASPETLQALADLGTTIAAETARAKAAIPTNTPEAAANP